MFYYRFRTTVFIACIFLALIATVLTFLLIVPEKRRSKMGRFGKFLHDTVNFKYLIIEKILQALYIFATCYVLAMGVLMLFGADDYNWVETIAFPIALLLLGPIAIRIVYELLIMAVLLVKNVISINNKLSRLSGEKPKDVLSRMEDKGNGAAPVPTGRDTAAKFCTLCGSRLNEDGTCPVCGGSEK